MIAALTKKKITMPQLMSRHKRKDSLKKQLNNVAILTNLLRHLFKRSVEQEYYDTPEDKLAIHSVATNVLVSRQSK